MLSLLSQPLYLQGGTLLSEASTVDAVTAATLAFQTNTDPKAAAIVGFSWNPTTSQVRVIIVKIYGVAE